MCVVLSNKPEMFAEVLSMTGSLECPRERCVVVCRRTEGRDCFALSRDNDAVQCFGLGGVYGCYF